MKQKTAIFSIEGRPIPYVRTTQKQKFKDKAYRRYCDFKSLVIWEYRRQCKDMYFNKNIEVAVKCYLKGKSTPMGKDGDVDNYLKAVLDSLNKVAYPDDRLIIKGTVTKEPSEVEGIEITIKGQ
jgi:Holliday junction resolvase RusA-like endonuclease